jgi:hypothetical protein
MSPFSGPFFWGTQSEGSLLPNRATAFREGHKKSSVGVVRKNGVRQDFGPV